ncbi:MULTISPECIES: hypothetical protein [Ralstonia solanacearum species complex]|uniref:hypothetical protein n=1 Tax=Ralstonia solanacearum species complex TaxID=3116862 RepID=UPI0010717D8D|nr:hypothetical protein [Ralstonia solanacearum]
MFAASAPWHDKKEKRPIFRSGTIASDPRYNYSFEDTVAGDCVAYEAFSYGGSSGGPVLALQKGLKPGAGISMTGYRPARLVWINTGHLKEMAGSNRHSGMSYFYKSTALLELIDR